MVDETDEQFEERVLNKRAYQMFLVVKQKFNAADTINLSDMCYRSRKKLVSGPFNLRFPFYFEVKSFSYYSNPTRLTVNENKAFSNGANRNTQLRLIIGQQ